MIAVASRREKPRRGMTTVASRFNGWYKTADGKRAFRYATPTHCRRVPTARPPYRPYYQPLKWLATIV
ncbi:MAG: hypothetical protein II949_10490 [Prevotella sp.]|nr:hypothetical protein [Prevotella sp.]